MKKQFSDAERGQERSMSSGLWESWGQRQLNINFWATVCKTVRPMLLESCLSFLTVCDVGVLWPNGWMDQDETWHAARPRPWPDCVNGDPAPSPHKRGTAPNFRPVSAGRLDGDPAPLPKKGAEPPNFRPMSIVAKWLDGSIWHLTWRWASIQATLC